jgi:hypothetical protein
MSSSSWPISSRSRSLHSPTSRVSTAKRTACSQVVTQAMAEGGMLQHRANAHNHTTPCRDAACRSTPCAAVCPTRARESYDGKKWAGSASNAHGGTACIEHASRSRWTSSCAHEVSEAKDMAGRASAAAGTLRACARGMSSTTSVGRSAICVSRTWTHGQMRRRDDLCLIRLTTDFR